MLTRYPRLYMIYNENIFASIIESSDDAIITKDLDGIIRSWNPGAEKVFGYTASEIIGKPVATLIPAGYEDEEPRILAQIRAGKKIDHYETVRRRKDGTLRNISLTVSPIKDATGKIIGASKIARDMTSQKLAEVIQLHHSAIVESSDDAILSKDLNGIIRSWNAGAQKVFGYTAPEIIGKPVATLIPAGHEDEEPRILAQIRAGKKIDHYETVRQRKDGTLLNISLTVSPIKDATGKIIGASKIARDVTPQKVAETSVRLAREELARLNDELEQRVKDRTSSLNDAVAQMEEFSYTISHDLRAPLRGAHVYAEAMMQDFGSALPPQAQHYLNRITECISRLDKMVLDVLTFSRTGRIDSHAGPVNVDLLVRQIVEQYPGMSPLNATIEIGELPIMIGDEASLTQVVSNLLTNAVKFVAPGVLPRIQIFGEHRDGWVRLSIRDNGIGIPPEYQHRLFNMFERIHPGMKYEGTGVGLAIVRRAAGRMDGRVGVESDGANGSVFWVELPAQETKRP